MATTPEGSSMLTDLNGAFIPQYWNPTTQQFEAITGSNGASQEQLSGSKATFGAPNIQTALNQSFTTSNSTTVSNTNPIMVPASRRNSVFILNTTQQTITVSPRYSNSNLNTIYGATASASNDSGVAILAGTTYLLDKNDFPHIDSDYDLLYFHWSSSTAPTTNKLVIIVMSQST